jgi:LSD1 subclass zinc finger protein
VPIVFSCSGCAKPLQVPDSAGGKKTRCPACGSIATAPPAPPQFEVVEEPPPPPPRPVARPVPPVEVEYADAPPPPRQRKPEPEDDARPMALAEPEPPRRKKRRRRLKPSRVVHNDSGDSSVGYQTKRVMFIGLGTIICIGGIVAMFADDRPVRFLRGICAIIVGGGLIIQGLTGEFED